MKERFLKAILRILAIVAKEEDVTKEETDVVRLFLLQNMRESDVGAYMQFFHDVSDAIANYTKEQGSVEIGNVCNELNKELKQTEKLLLTLYLVELICADGIITQQEDYLLFLTASHLKIDKESVQFIKHFIIHQKKEKLDSAYTLMVDDGAGPSFRSSKRITHKNMKGFIVILHLAKYGMYFVKHVGKDTVFLNGVHLSARKAMNVASGSVIKTSTGLNLHYSDVVGAFVDTSDKEPIELNVQKISYAFKGSKMGLQHISFRESGGRLMAIMGGSGSGKSTLINALSGTLKPKKGRVYINGIDIYKDRQKIEGIIGYVPQEDLLIQDLTVFENLYYAAKLCFKDLSPLALTRRVEKTLSDLRLLSIRNLRVGSPLKHIVSGGQRKRLNIALELIREPSVLFLDEPTSGLSSRDSEHIMDLLKDLSLKGTLIITVIHQPSSLIFKMFDSLLILDYGGYQIYYGKPVEAVTYFKELMDHIDKDRVQCIECGNVNPEQIFNIIETRVIDEYGRQTDKRRVLPPKWQEFFHRSPHAKEAKIPKKSPLPKRKTLISGRIRQFTTFIQRGVRAKIYNRQYMIINLLEPIFLALTLAFVVKQIPEETYYFGGNENIAAYFFMSIIVALFMGLTVSAEEIFNDRLILKRERFLHLSRFSYLSSKVAILFTLSAIQTFTYVLVGDFILEIREMTFSYWLVLFSISCFANLLGLNISSAFNSAVTIYIIVPLLIIPQIILSGAIVSFDSLTPSISNKRHVPLLGEIMASRWAMEALLVKQYKDNPYMRNFYDIEKKIANAEYIVNYWEPMISDYLQRSWSATQSGSAEEAKEALSVLRREMEKMIGRYGDSMIPNTEGFRVGQFNREWYDKSRAFIDRIKSYHLSQRKQSLENRTALQQEKASSSVEEPLADMRKKYHNDYTEKIVKNMGTKQAIVVTNDELIPIIYPIYNTPSPRHAWDFRTRFLYPVKHFGGKLYQTLYFNVVVIWLMSLLLFFTLYFNVLKRIISGKLA